MAENICFIEDCDYPVLARSMCSMHYSLWYRGKLDITPPEPMSPVESGAMGGASSKTGGFFANRELAREAGSKGGKSPRRRK